jgi:CheY-like chemotaxis protein
MPAFRTVPIIAFTAHALEDERVNALRDGFDEVISKPCLPDDLVAAIDRLLAREVPPTSSA